MAEVNTTTTFNALTDDGLVYLWAALKLKFASIDSIVTKTSELINDSNFQDDTQVSSAIEAAVNMIKQLGVSTFNNDADYMSYNAVTNLDVSTFNNDAEYQNATQVRESIESHDEAIKNFPVSTFDNDAGYQTENDVDNFISRVPISTFQNDSNYQNDLQVLAAIADAIGEMKNAQFEKVETLPETGETGIIYLVPRSKVETDNIYDEYIWVKVNEVYKYEKIGSTDIDLSGYVKKEDLQPITNARIDEILAM